MTNWPSAISQFIQDTWQLWIAMGLPAGTWLGGWTFGYGRAVEKLEAGPTETKKRLREAEAKLIHIREAAKSESLVWNKPRPSDSPRVRRVGLGGRPIITVANLKGGVGKTTTAANLAALFDKAFGKRVLAIDLDYQGSLNAMMLLAAARNLDRKERNLANYFIEGGHSVEALRQLPIPLQPALQHTRVVPAYHPLAVLENQLQFSWITGETNADIRYQLASTLQAFVDLDLFDICIIDAPPRMTTGFINAMCASTHLLVPTILDGLSAEATVYFFEQVHALRDELFPQLEYLGVVPTLVQSNTGLANHESQQEDYINTSLSRWLGPGAHVLSQCAIPRRAAISQAAGEGLIYVSGNPAERAIWDELGEALALKMGITRS